MWRKILGLRIIYVMNFRSKIRFQRTTLLAIGCFAVLAGLAAARLGAPVLAGVLPLAALVSLLTFRRRNWYALLAVIAFGFSIGIARGASYMDDLAPYDDLFGQKVVMMVEAAEDATYGNNSQLTFRGQDIVAVEPMQGTLPGKMRISGFGEPMVYKGDILQIEGKLYPRRGGEQSQMSYADMKVIGQNATFVDDVRRNFAAGMQNALPEPLASFGLGLLIGQRSGLPDDVAEQLSTVGLTHIIAVSGYNLTIIVMAVRRLGGKLSKYQTVIVSGVLIGLFLLATGFSASIVRAALVSGLGLWAWYYGRTFRPILLIGFTAAVTALWYPLYLWGDIGWYLSFLAFFGVLIVAPVFARRFFTGKELRLAPSILLETSAAQLMTLPLILFIFQQLSFVSLVSNLLVVPVVPLAMLVSLAAGLAGMFVPMYAGWFAWPARFVLTYMLDMAALLARVPHALGQYALSVQGLVYAYGLIMAMLGVMWRKTRPIYGIITDKNTDS